MVPFEAAGDASSTGSDRLDGLFAPSKPRWKHPWPAQEDQAALLIHPDVEPIGGNRQKTPLPEQVAFQGQGALIIGTLNGKQIGVGINPRISNVIREHPEQLQLAIGIVELARRADKLSPPFGAVQTEDQHAEQRQQHHNDRNEDFHNASAPAQT